MSLEISPKLNNKSNIQPQKTQIDKEPVAIPEKPDKKKSSSFKLMVGATCLAGVIALGIASHKNNWWRKIANTTAHAKPDPPKPQTATNSTASTAPIKQPESNNPITNSLERIRNKIQTRFTKENKYARRNVRQYNEIYSEYYEFTNPNGFNLKGNYLEFLQSKGYKYETTEDGLKIFDQNNKLCRILHSSSKTDYSTLNKGTFIEYLNKNGKVNKVVTLNKPEDGSLQLLISYKDPEDNTTKVLNGIGRALENTDSEYPTIVATYLRNNKVIKESTYLNCPNYLGDGITSRVTDYSKTPQIYFINVTGQAGSKYAHIKGKTYQIPNNNSQTISQISMNKFPIINYNYAVVNNHEILEFKYSDPNSSFVIKDLKTGLKKCKFEFEAPQYNTAGEYTLTYREFSPEQQTKPISGFSESYKENVEQGEIIAHRKKAA